MHNAVRILTLDLAVHVNITSSEPHESEHITLHFFRDFL